MIARFIHWLTGGNLSPDTANQDAYVAVGPRFLRNFTDQPSDDKSYGDVIALPPDWGR